MKVDLDHLPDVQRAELERVQKILLTEFAEATSRASQPWKRNGRISKIILFGSYSRMTGWTILKMAISPISIC